MITKEEQSAINALVKLAAKWPKTLTLVHHGDSAGLHVKKCDQYNDNLADIETVVRILIPAGSCA